MMCAHFIAFIYCLLGVNLHQVDALWNCLSPDPECRDELFSWLLSQTKAKDQHALGIEAFKHVFLEKMPSLEPENMSMIGLNLFMQLCNMAKIANASLNRPLDNEEVTFLFDQLIFDCPGKFVV